LTNQLQKHINYRRFWVIYLLFLNLPLSHIQLNAQSEDYQIENFFIDEGLPVTRIRSINQDNNGLIWISSERQLYSFNGSQFDLQLEYDEINFYPEKLFIDNNGNKWLIEVLLTTVESYKDDVINIKIIDNNNNEMDISKYLNLDKTKIYSIYQNSQGVILFRNENSFYSFDTKPKEVELPKITHRFLYDDENFQVISSENEGFLIDKTTNELIKLLDSTGIYNVKKHKGLLYLYSVDGSFYIFNPVTKDLNLLSNKILKHDVSLIFDFILDDKDNIWVSKNRQVLRYDLKERKEHEVDLKNKYQTTPFYTSIFNDREENIWIGTNLGVSKISQSTESLFSSSNAFPYSTRLIQEINDNELFISTYEGNFIYNLSTDEHESVNHSGTIVDIFKTNEFYYTVDKKNNLEKFKDLRHNSLKKIKINQAYREGKYPGNVIRLSNNKMYFLIYHTLYEFDEDLNLKVVLQDKTKKSFYNHLQEENGKIYLFTNNGISVYDLNFNLQENILDGQSAQLMHVDKDDNNTLWISSNFQLIKYDLEKKTYKNINPSTKFLNKNFTAIEEDQNGNLWLPSFVGLNKLNKKTLQNQVYFEADGISNNEFNNYSTLKLKDGRIIFGGISGFSIIDPSRFSNIDIKYPKIQIYSCKMLNSKKSQKVDLTKEVNVNSVLKYDEYDIESTIQLAHYSYKDLKSKQFKYRIFEKNQNPSKEQWTNINNNDIILGRLPYGKYRLQYQVESRFRNKISEINEIEVHYIKPFYKTLLFWLISSILLILGLIQFINFRSESLMQQKELLEAEVKLRTKQIEVQKQELENINNTKDKLFSIIAHDLKSPLITLSNISGKINYLIKKGQPNRIIEIGKTIEDKVSNLTVFLDNLLNWSLQQRGHFNYKPQDLLIHNITEEIINLYEDLIQEKKIEFKIDIPTDSICYADENSIKTVIRNIIHNAIKYSPKDSLIEIKYSKGQKYNTLAISDKGVGIPQSVIKAVHNKEYIKNTPGTIGEKGTGLGFLISKELMDLNKGKLVFQVNERPGTTVQLLLPASQ